MKEYEIKVCPRCGEELFADMPRNSIMAMAAVSNRGSVTVWRM